MANLTIHLPVFEAEHKIEIDVKVNGTKNKLHYRVELFEWNECEDSENKAQCLENVIKSYDPQWQIVQIGEATKDTVQIMFKEKKEHLCSEIT
jgi:hypothetical protein